MRESALPNGEEEGGTCQKLQGLLYTELRPARRVVVPPQRLAGVVHEH